MYYNGQIVYDLDKKIPVIVGGGHQTDWAWDNLPKRSTHFLKRENFKEVIFCPKTLSEAEDFLRTGIIQPAPIADTHCWKCLGWLSNHQDKQPCSEVGG